MNKRKIIVHRANSPLSGITPEEQVSIYYSEGFRKIEIDVYAVSEFTYKFCHPLDKEKITKVYNFDDNFLFNFVKKLPGVEWYVDLKCLDLESVPLEMLEHLANVFGGSSIFIAAQKEILEFINKNDLLTGQYFKEGISSDLGFEPDSYIIDEGDIVDYPNSKTIIFTKEHTNIDNLLEEGYKLVMIDGAKLLS